MNTKKHSLSLDSRNRLEITAVDEVLSFDETLISLSVGGCVLNISGDDLSVKNLSIDCGDITVCGHIGAMVYFDEAPRGKRFSIFGRR